MGFGFLPSDKFWRQRLVGKDRGLYYMVAKFRGMEDPLAPGLFVPPKLRPKTMPRIPPPTLSVLWSSRLLSRQLSASCSFLGSTCGAITTITSGFQDPANPANAPAHVCAPGSQRKKEFLPSLKLNASA